MADFPAEGQFGKRLSSSSKGGAIAIIIKLLAVCGLAMIFIALMLPATQRSRSGARITQCKNNLKQIALALRNYEAAYGTLPPAYTVDAEGRRLHSWRVLILPFIDHNEIYTQIDLSKSWEDPANATVYERFLPVYCCPSATWKPNLTTYLAIVNSEGGFRCAVPGTGAKSPNNDFQSIMVVEATSDQAIHWMSPSDSDGEFLEQLSPKANVAHPKGFHLLLDDGTVRLFSKTIQPR